MMTYGWLVNDVVTFVAEWCAICTKSRNHEVFGPHKICLGCGDQETKEETIS